MTSNTTPTTTTTTPDASDDSSTTQNTTKTNHNASQNTTSSITKSQISKRLQSLRYKLNQAHQHNLQEVLKEKSLIRSSAGASRGSRKKKERNLDSGAAKGENSATGFLQGDEEQVQSSNAAATTSTSTTNPTQNQDNQNDTTEAASNADNNDSDEEAPQMPNLSVTIAQCERKKQSLKRKRKNMAKSGWEMHQDRYRSMKKRAQRVPYTMEEYQESMQRHKEALSNGTDSATVSNADDISEHNKNRMVTELQQQQQRRNQFHRRREFFENENVDYINEANRLYNQRVEKSYGKYTKNLKQGLERGTRIE